MPLHLVAQVRAPRGRPAFAEARPGAGGAMTLNHASPDGAVVALLSIAVPVLAPRIWKDVQYDAAHDFALASVSQIASYCLAFAGSADHPAKSFPDFMTWMTFHPSRSLYGTPAAVSLSHHLGVMFFKAVRIEMCT